MRDPSKRVGITNDAEHEDKEGDEENNEEEDEEKCGEEKKEEISEIGEETRP